MNKQFTVKAHEHLRRPPVQVRLPVRRRRLHADQPAHRSDVHGARTAARRRPARRSTSSRTSTYGEIYRVTRANFNSARDDHAEVLQLLRAGYVEGRRSADDQPRHPLRAAEAGRHDRRRLHARRTTGRRASARSTTCSATADRSCTATAARSTRASRTTSRRARCRPTTACQRADYFDAEPDAADSERHADADAGDGGVDHQHFRWPASAPT